MAAADDIWGALRRLAVRLANDPITQLGLSILFFNAVVWAVLLLRGEVDQLLLAIVGTYDVVVGATALLQALIRAKVVLRVLLGR